MTDLDVVVRTGAWIRPDERPPAREPEAFLNAGTPPVYVGFGSMTMRTTTDTAQVAITAAQGRRAVVSRGWAGPAPIDDRDDCLAAHDGQAPTAASLSAALRTAPTPETRARASAVAATIRTDGATGRRWPPSSCSTRSAGKGPPCPPEPHRSRRPSYARWSQSDPRSEPMT